MEIKEIYMKFLGMANLEQKQKLLELTAILYSTALENATLSRDEKQRRRDYDQYSVSGVIRFLSSCF